MNNVLPARLACEDHDFENGKEGKVDSCYYIEEKKIISGMEIQEQVQEEEEEEEENHEMDFEIWPVQHPLEPQDEDKPVKCPMPQSSLINDEGKREKKLLGKSLRKRAEEKSSENYKSKHLLDSEDKNSSAVRAVRKRHHTLTGEDDQVHVIVPFSSRPHRPPLPGPTNNLNVFQMLHQNDKLE